ncbi:MAG: nucleoside recognition protein [Lachnospiraceae bacterium]|nr:nucleoside recognition protein [Lachnospiraceae bacterium]
MLNYIWGGMIIIGIAYAICTGNMEAVTNGIISSSKEAINLSITMLGVVSLWMGLMEIAEKSGIMDGLVKAVEPFVKWFFPEASKDETARKYIAINIVANIVGLGQAATPAGLKAMEAMSVARKDSKKEIATDDMCTFIVLNISSLQLIPVNMIAYRSQYGSVNPAGIIVPGIIATTIGTIVAVIYCKLRCGKKNRGL